MTFGQYLGMIASLVGFALAAAPAGAQTAASPPPQAESPASPDLLVFSAGAYNIDRNQRDSAELGLQYRNGGALWGIFHWHVGVLGTTLGSKYAYVGPLADFNLGHGLFLTLSTAGGAYQRGGDYNLGSSALMFRSGGEIAYQFDTLSRLGLDFYHISDGGMSSRNPGEETLALAYGLAF